MTTKSDRPAAARTAHGAADTECRAGCSNSPFINPPRPDQAPQPEIKVGSAMMSRAAANQVSAIMEPLQVHAAMLGGPRAFEMTKASAAWHEAGHAVVSATLGTVPTRVEIWETEGDWEGHTAGTLPELIDAHSLVKNDHAAAVMALSGRLAEELFDSDFRMGSSLFELAQAFSFARIIAIKTGTDISYAWRAICIDTEARLMAHKQVVRVIATELMRKHIIRSRRLAAHLAPIVRRAPR